MRSLPVLLIALALLPLSAALKCYQGAKNIVPEKLKGGFASSPKVEKDCKNDFCVWIHKESIGPEGTIKEWAFKCDDPDYKCEKEDCKKKDAGTMKGYTRTEKLCCCKSNLCNGSDSPPNVPGSPAVAPTALLSLAALAAMLAARF